MYGYARVSTDGQSLDAQVKQLRAAGAEKVFRETASGAQTDRAQLRRALGQLAKGDVLSVTRLDRLARSTRDLLNTLATITAKGAGFRSLNDAWADTTTAHGRLMLTVLFHFGTLREPSAILKRESAGAPVLFTAYLDKRQLPAKTRAKAHAAVMTTRTASASACQRTASASACRMVTANTHGRARTAQPGVSAAARMTPSSQGARPKLIIG
jgi:Resolvase, N terminal domain